MLKNPVRKIQLESVTSQDTRLKMPADASLATILSDEKPETEITVGKFKNGKNIMPVILHYTFKKEEKFNHVNFLFYPMPRRCAVRIEAKVDGKWKLISEDAAETRSFPTIKSSAVRVTLFLYRDWRHDPKEYKIKEMGFYYAPE